MRKIPSGLAPVFFIPGLLFETVIRARNAFYAAEVLTQRRLARPVISIGNITMGGTGKTPLVIYVAQTLARFGFIPAVLSRGYKRIEPNRSHILSPGENVPSPARVLGDEPALIRRHVSSAWMGISKNRFLAGNLIAVQQQRTAFILDDGFQYRGLYRDLDIVIIDSSQPLELNRVFPRGTLREPLSELCRCHIIVVNGVRDEAETKSVAGEIRRIHPKARVFYCKQTIRRLLPFSAWKEEANIKSGTDTVQSAYLVTALGNPERFERDIRQLGIEVRGKRFFPDHYWLKPQDWSACAEQARSKNAGMIITTEKDAVKISHPPNFPLLVSLQSTEISDAKEFELALKNCTEGENVNPREIAATKKILIRGTNWVGDAVISIPAMREIRRIFPAAHISLLVRPWVKDIYSAVDFIDEILEYDKNGLHRGIMGFRRLISDLKSRRFDMAILMQNAFEAALIALCARIPKRVGYARDGRSLLLTGAIRIDPEVRTVHQAYYYLGILSGLGLSKNRPWQCEEYALPLQIGVRDEDRATARKILQFNGIQEGDLVVGVNPGAYYGEAKRWFPDRYAGVADAIAEQYGARILLFGAQSDLGIVQEVDANMKHTAVILAGRTTLGQLMGLIKECDLLITNDSGPMHLAAALDVPQLAIFGSTSEIATGPLNRKAVVIKHQVECNPCFLKTCPTDFRCMKEISAGQVLEAAQKLLEKKDRGSM